MVRFFDRKEYYSVHGDAAEFVARTFYRTTSVIKTLARPSAKHLYPRRQTAHIATEPRSTPAQGSGDNALQGVTLNRALFETVLRQLLLEASGTSLVFPCVARHTDVPGSPLRFSFAFARACVEPSRPCCRPARAEGGG